MQIRNISILITAILMFTVLSTAQPSVKTVDGEQIGLSGQVTANLTQNNSENTEVWFEYRRSGATTWNNTSINTLTEEKVVYSSFKPSKIQDYEFRAKANNSQGLTTGSTKTISFNEPGFSGGDGSNINPYRISTCKELQNIHWREEYDKYYELVSDIDCTNTENWHKGSKFPGGHGFIPVGSTHDSKSSGNTESAFAGYFDGNNHQIKNVEMDWNGRKTGLFSQNDGLVENIKLSNSYLRSSYSGVLIGENTGTAQNINASNIEISGGDYLGGIIGQNKGILSRVTASKIEFSAKSRIGGIIGGNTGTAQNINASNIKVGGGNYGIGGIVGENGKSPDYDGNKFPGIIENAAVTNIDIFGRWGVGGLTGMFNDGRLENTSVKNSTITGRGTIGGLIGDGYSINGAKNYVYNAKVVNSNINLTIKDDYTPTGGIAGSIGGGEKKNILLSNSTILAETEFSGILIGLYEGYSGNFENIFASEVKFQGPTGINEKDDLMGYKREITSSDVTGLYWDKESINIDESGEEFSTAALTTAQSTGLSVKDNMPEFNFGTIWRAKDSHYPGISSEGYVPDRTNETRFLDKIPDKVNLGEFITVRGGTNTKWSHIEGVSAEFSFIEEATGQKIYQQKNVVVPGSDRTSWRPKTVGSQNIIFEVDDGFRVKTAELCVDVEDDNTAVLGCEKNWVKGSLNGTIIDDDSVSLREDNSSGSFTSEVFDTNGTVVWNELEIDSRLNEGAVEGQVEFSNDEGFSSVEDSVSFDLEDSNSFSLENKEFPYARVKLQLADGVSRPEINEILLRYSGLQVDTSLGDEIVNKQEIVGLTGSTDYLPQDVNVSDRPVQVLLNDQEIGTTVNDVDLSQGSFDSTEFSEELQLTEAASSGSYLSESFTLDSQQPLRIEANVSQSVIDEHRTNITLETVDGESVDRDTVRARSGLNREFVGVEPGESYRVNVTFETGSSSSPVLNNLNVYLSNYSTNSNGNFNLDFESPSSIGRSSIETVIPFEGETGSVSRSFSVRNLTLDSSLIDSEDDRQDAFNPGESYDFEFEINEFNGTDSFEPAQDSDFNIEIDQNSYPLQHVKNSVWRTKEDFNSENSLGDFSAEFDVDADSGNGIIETGSRSLDYSVENISITEVLLSQTKVNPGENFTVSGETILEPYKAKVNGSISALFNSVSYENSTDNGDYLLNLQAPENIGVYELDLNVVNAEKITGFNSSSFEVLSSSIDVNHSKKLYRDDSDTPQYNFNDSLTADSANPSTLQEVEYSTYSLPKGWRIENLGQTFTTELEAGDNISREPDIGIGPNAELGEQLINLSSSSANGITSEEQAKIEVWSKANVKAVNPPNVIDQDEGNYTFRAEVRDYVTNELIPGQKVRFEFGNTGQGGTTTSNENGIANYTINVENIPLGTKITTRIPAEDTPENYINTTETPDIFSFEVLGIMQLESFDTQGAVYGNNPYQSRIEDTKLMLNIADSSGSPLNTGSVNISAPGDTFSPKTPEDGEVNFTYSPSADVEPGMREVNISANKTDFDEFTQTEFVEVRGILDVNQTHGKDEFIVDNEYQLESNVEDINGKSRDGSTQWSINDQKIASGDQVTWVPQLSPENYTLSAETSRNFFNNSKDEKEIRVFGEADITDLRPGDSQISPGATVDVEAVVEDSSTGEPVENVEVTLTADGEVIDVLETNSEGLVSTPWTVPEEGVTKIKANIGREDSINYIAGKNEAVSEVEAVDALRLEEFSLSEEEIYRTTIRDPSQSVLEVKLSETASQEENIPAQENVSFKIGSSKTLSCSTDSEGTCSTVFEPSSTSSLGAQNINITTNRPGWENIDSLKQITVIDLLSTTIEQPNRLVRGETNSLVAAATDGNANSVNVPANWSFENNKIGEGLETTWDVPATQEIGGGILELEASSEKYERSTSSQTTNVFGQASVSLETSNDSAISYSDTPNIGCRVENQIGGEVADYPVSLFVDSKKVGEGTTTANGIASIPWNINESVGSYNLSCRIDDEEDLYYTADQKVDSKSFTVVDDVPPVIENIQVSPAEPNLGSSVRITFEVYDTIDIEPSSIDSRVEFRGTSYLENVTATEIYEEGSQTGYSYAGDYETSETEGTRQLVIEAEDTNGNTQTRFYGFDVASRGALTTSQNKLSASEITQSEGEKFNVDLNFTTDSDEIAENVNVSSSLLDGKSISAENDALCSNRLEESESCSETFTLNVEPGAVPQTAFIQLRTEWYSTVEEEEYSVRKLVELDVEENPVLDVEPVQRNQQNQQHGERSTVDFNVKSVGNQPVEGFSTELMENNISQEWTSIENGELNSISPGDETSTTANVDIPEGQAPGNYSSEILFESSNTESESEKFSVDVFEDVNFDVSLEKTDLGAVADYRDNITSIEITNTGNTEFDVENNFVQGDVPGELSASTVTLQPLETKNASLTADIFDTGNYSATLGFEADSAALESSHSEQVDVNIEVIDFTADILTSENTIERSVGDNTTVRTNLTLEGDPVTNNFSITALLERSEGSSNQGKTVEADNVQVRETSEDGVYDVTATVPDVEDGRTYDLIVRASEENTGATTQDRINSRIKIPDITPPKIQTVNADSINSGQETTIQVKASDNGLKGVKNISATIPNLTKSLNLSKTSDGLWSSNTTVNEPGKYEFDVVAYDFAQNKREDKGRFRVAESTDLSISLEEWDSEAKVNKTFTDSYTGEQVGSIVNENNSYTLNNLLEGKYDIDIEYNNFDTKLKGAEINSSTSNIVDMEEISSVDAPSPPADKRIMSLGARPYTEIEGAEITFNYPADGDFEVESLSVAKCPEYNYDEISCNSDYEIYELEEKNIDRRNNQITINTSGFSSYTLYEPGDSNQEENESEDSGSSGGGGGGGGSAPDYSQELEQINDSVSDVREELLVNNTDSISFGSSSIDADIAPGENKRISIEFTNNKNQTQNFNIMPDSVIEPYVEVPEDIELDSGESTDILVNVSAPTGERPGSYSGVLNIQSTGVDARMPVNIRILPPDNQLLDLSVDPILPTVKPGDEMRVEVFASNEGFARNVDITVDLKLIDPDTNEVVVEKQETLAVGTTLTQVMSLQIPEGTEMKQYELRGSTRYTNIDADMVATSISNVNVDLPFWERTFGGITYMGLAQITLILAITSIIGYSAYTYRKQKIMEKKRYLEKIDLGQIPGGGKNQAFVGEIAEMGKRTFIDLDDLKTHALIAGSTGSGKTVTGQVIIEEALKKGVNVIVLDPTAQWTGFLRENNDSTMKQLYRDFGMTLDDAQAFNGNIRAVEPGQEKVDIEPYLKEDEKNGDIIVFSMHKLDNENMDKFVDTTIQQVFDANLNEKDHLETLIVYDEAHRILEKFGGSGQGLDQLERGAREFRKWGIGMMLFSQVVSDFPGEFRANVNTTIQMRTQYDGDLERVKNKFGTDTVKSIAKAEVGSGMLHNSDYNHGRPYFVNFRPLLHSSHRLSDQKLDKYEKFNKQIDKLEAKVNKLEESGEEVYEYRSEIKLAKKNLRKGSFNLVNMYLDEIQDKLEN